MSPRSSSLLCALLCASSLACKAPEEILAERAPAMKARLKQLKAVCAQVAAQRAAPLKAARPPEPLVVFGPDLNARTKLNAMIMDADLCPELALKLDDRSKSLGASAFDLGSPHPALRLADVYLRDNKYAREVYVQGRADVGADSHALDQLRYVIVWTLDTLELPRLDAQAQRFEPGSVRGRALLFRLEDAALLSVVAFDAKNTSDATISHGKHTIQRQEQVYTKERIGLTGSEFEDTPTLKTRTTTAQLDLGPWESAAARDLMMQLSFAAEASLKRALPYEDSPR